MRRKRRRRRIRRGQRRRETWVTGNTDIGTGISIETRTRKDDTGGDTGAGMVIVIAVAAGNEDGTGQTGKTGSEDTAGGVAAQNATMIDTAAATDQDKTTMMDLDSPANPASADTGVEVEAGAEIGTKGPGTTIAGAAEVGAGAEYSQLIFTGIGPICELTISYFSYLIKSRGQLPV